MLWIAMCLVAISKFHWERWHTCCCQQSFLQQLKLTQLINMSNRYMNPSAWIHVEQFSFFIFPLWIYYKLFHMNALTHVQGFLKEFQFEWTSFISNWSFILRVHQMKLTITWRNPLMLTWDCMQSLLGHLFHPVVLF